MRRMAFLLLTAVLAALFGGLPAQHAAEKRFEILIKNARIADGTGNPWFRGEIGIKNGKIAAVGFFDERDADQVFDAGKRIVAPGFIDVHGHTENIFRLPEAENFVRMGVTSIITGNCGSSVTDVAKFLGNFEKTPIAVNLGTLIGHNDVRGKVLGLENRAPSPEELARMKQIVDQAMKDGAFGFSTGLIYVPGTYAETPEVVELAKAAAMHKGIYASHIRDEGEEVFEAIREAINIGEQAQMPVEISHFKISSKRLWNKSDETLGLVRAARAKGLPVTVDQYAYTASSTSLDTLLPSWVLAGGREEGRKRLADEKTRIEIVKEMKKSLKQSQFKDYSYANIASFAADEKLNGLNIKQAAEKQRGKSDLNAQIEQIFEIYGQGGAQMVFHKMSESDVERIMREPFTMIASDSGVRRFGEGVPHPRGYGNNVRVLGRYVRELKTISLEDGIRKMTSLPAQTFGLRERGLIREGFAADLVIFDEKQIGDTATFENPHQYPTGIERVFVNGKIVFADGKMTGVYSGTALKHSLP